MPPPPPSAVPRALAHGCRVVWARDGVGAWRVWSRVPILWRDRDVSWTIHNQVLTHFMQTEAATDAGAYLVFRSPTKP